MEGEKDNYRECWTMQEEDGVGDVLLVVVLGEEKDSKQQQTPPLSPSFHPTPPTHPHLLPPSYLCRDPAGTTVYLGGNIVTSGFF